MLSDLDNGLARLLGDDEPAAFRLHRGSADSAFVIVGDHASQRIPRALGDLGVAPDELQRHIAWDIGISGVIDHVAVALDAFAIQQNYSRLVIDCNRPPGVSSSIPLRSEHTEIPGNQNLSAEQREQREREIFHPYHAAIVAELDRRLSIQQPTFLVSLHSFTPVYDGVARPWHLGVLYHRGVDVAQRCLALMRESGEWNVGDNQPYALGDLSDYAVPVHGERRGLPHVELEIRQDLIADAAGQREWGLRIAEWLRQLADASLTPRQA